MKKISLILTFIISLIILNACVKSVNYEDYDQGDMYMYYKHKEGNIGDVMPFYDEGRWNVFYLHDSPPKPGFHPWYRISTEDFLNFEDHGEVIPVVHDPESQELALGTGSVIKKDNIYYAFYTQHNGNLRPKEKIAYSYSTDGMKTWVKEKDSVIDPRDFGFDIFDFRDPEVVFIPEKDVYYMLFTTRYQGKGAIGYLVSDDLKVWEKEKDGIFFLNNIDTGTSSIDSNLECPTLINHKGMWYLTFSDQWPTRVTHYLLTDDLDKGFRKPENNVFDGTGLYAGKIDTDGDRIMLMGWISYDFNRNGENGWGGNFIAHEIDTLDNGELIVKVIKEVDEKINNRRPLEVILNSNNKLNDFKYKNNSGLCYVVFDELTEINKITGEILLGDKIDTFGLFFDFSDNESSFFYELDLNYEEMSFNKGSFTKNNIDKLYSRNNLLKNNESLKFTLLFEEGRDADGTIVTLYIDGQFALSGRMFLTYKTNFGFYSKNSDIEFKNIKLYK